MKSPNSSASVAEIDFITAFARLLRDGNLRETFAANPGAAAQQIHLCPPDLRAWLQLNPTEVEFQAEVLLRKRLDSVKFFAPETCRRLGEKLWPLFRDYARANWPPVGAAKFFDAFLFCQRLKQQTPAVLAVAEWNRLDFAASNRRLKIGFVRMPDTKRRPRRGLQIFLRGKNRRSHEFFFHFGL